MPGTTPTALEGRLILGEVIVGVLKAARSGKVNPGSCNDEIIRAIFWKLKPLSKGARAGLRQESFHCCDRSIPTAKPQSPLTYLICRATLPKSSTWAASSNV